MRVPVIARMAMLAMIEGYVGASHNFSVVDGVITRTEMAHKNILRYRMNDAEIYPQFRPV